MFVSSSDLSIGEMKAFYINNSIAEAPIVSMRRQDPDAGGIVRIETSGAVSIDATELRPYQPNSGGTFSATANSLPAVPIFLTLTA
ncbi:hypothetical protein CWO84_17445 [Methylomonas sp. Kb3]|uniref:hypothetical protein n=1 Tax=Methylomonas sp. Kb3 TaxID=1611544 RepID=UPI000C322ABF|nr:hypothetical protein [Methylomonas sp. Kb3]PKD38840.1 hypothetical protein CWO84_17445 [Methylomonas sp. Kb3]